MNRSFQPLMEESKKRYEDKVSDLEAKKGELNDIINETHKDEESLQTKSEELAATIDERLLTAYRRIRSNARNGLAVVTVIPYWTKHRPSQLREVSDLSPTITRVRDTNEFITAVSVKERCV